MSAGLELNERQGQVAGGTRISEAAVARGWRILSPDTERKFPDMRGTRASRTLNLFGVPESSTWRSLRSHPRASPARHRFLIGSAGNPVAAGLPAVTDGCNSRAGECLESFQPE
jgi:hypothetical protein